MTIQNAYLELEFFYIPQKILEQLDFYFFILSTTLVHELILIEFFIDLFLSNLSKLEMNTKHYNIFFFIQSSMTSDVIEVQIRIGKGFVFFVYILILSKLFMNAFIMEETNFS